ncbi:MAG: hypothetical protein IJ344_04705 [Clostridia bacterium]|nr:hypothetical protein [Clostridia bacterium]
MDMSIADVEVYLNTLIAEYSDTPSELKEYLVQELNGVQQLYFKRFAKEVTSVSRAASSDQTILLSSGLDAFLQAPQKEDVIAVFYEGERLPIFEYEDFLSSARPGCAIKGETVYLRRSAPPNTDYMVEVVFRACPKAVLSLGGTIQGAVYIPPMYLPMLTNKMKECIARSALQYEDADHYAKAYNNWIAFLQAEEQGGAFAKEKEGCATGEMKSRAAL